LRSTVWILQTFSILQHKERPTFVGLFCMEKMKKSKEIAFAKGKVLIAFAKGKVFAPLFSKSG